MKNVITERVLFGAGCFWGVEEAFSNIKGVVSTLVGYAGGLTPHPTYKQVCMGNTGYAEVVEVEYDPKVISFDQLLGVFWDIHTPTELNRQGPDIGTQYRSVIFTTTDEQQRIAEEYKEKLAKSGKYDKEIVTKIEPTTSLFWPAEEYHQKYIKKNNLRSCHIKI
jgi:peptide-methionine (S)-S-oxide reductase